MPNIADAVNGVVGCFQGPYIYLKTEFEASPQSQERVLGAIKLLLIVTLNKHSNAIKMKSRIQKPPAVIAILFSTYSLCAQNRHVSIIAPGKEEFLKKNTSIDSIQQKSFDSITLFFKSGLTASYNLGVATERQKFIAQYGTPPHYLSDTNGRLSRRKKE